AGDKQATGIAQLCKVFLGAAQQVLDFDDDVVADFGKFAMERFGNGESMRRAIEKIRVAKSDVLGAGVDLATNIFENNFARDDTEDAVVDRHDGTVAAEMLATAAGFRVTG